MYPRIERVSLPDARVGSGYCAAKLQLPLADLRLWSVTLQTVSNYIPLLHSPLLPPPLPTPPSLLHLLPLLPPTPPSLLLSTTTRNSYVTKELYSFISCLSPSSPLQYLAVPPSTLSLPSLYHLSPPSLYPLSTLPPPSLHPPSTLSLPSLYPPSFIT